MSMSDFDMIDGSENLGLGEPGDNGGGATNSSDLELKAEIADIAADVEEASIEVQKAAEVLADSTEAIEEIAADIAGAEALLANSGNFEPIAYARLYNSARAKCVKHFGVPAKGATRLGAEDLYDASSAETQSRDGIEGIWDSVKAGAGKAVAWLKRIFDFIYNAITGLFNKGKALNNRIAKLKEQIGASAFKVKEKIKFGNWNGYIDYDANGLKIRSDKFFAFTGVINGFAELLDGKDISAADFGSKYSSLVSTMETAITAEAQARQAKEDDKDKVISERAGIRILFKYLEKHDSTLSGCAKAAKALGLAVGKNEKFGKLKSGDAKPKVEASGLTTFLGQLTTRINALENAKVDQKFNSGKRDRMIGYIGANASKDDKDTGERIALAKQTAAASARMTDVIYKLAFAYIEAGVDAAAAHV